MTYFESDEFMEAQAWMRALADQSREARLRPLRRDPHRPPYVCMNLWCRAPLTARKLCWRCDQPEAVWWEGDVCCVVYLSRMGHRNGYCRVPDAHPWHGLDYSDAGPVLVRALDAEILLEEAMDDFGVVPIFLAGASGNLDDLAVTPAGQIRVHGGVTYAGPLNFVLGAPRGWWFGFDTGHSGDAPEPDHPHTRRIRELLGALPSEKYDVVRSHEFVQFECKRMAATIAAGMRHSPDQRP